MNVWLLAGLGLMVGGLGPTLWLGARGNAQQRLVALQLAGPLAVLALLLLAHGFAQPSYLMVPLVLAVLSFAGTLVFTRLLLEPRR